MEGGPNRMRLEAYSGARVTVQYGGTSAGFSDTGTLTYIDGIWVEVTKEKGERLLIPVTAIRHIKLLEPAKPAGDPATLLRASAKEPAEQRK